MVNHPCESNIATISGTISSELTFGHEVYGEGFYYFMVDVRRLSSSCDRIPVTVSERLMDFSEYRIGRYIEVDGQFRSYNAALPEGGTKLMLTVFAREIAFPPGPENDQDIPCISWGRNARYCGRLTVGENVKVTGRIQSRSYQKKLANGEAIEKVAYEVSVSKLELLSANREILMSDGKKDPPLT